MLLERAANLSAKISQYERLRGTAEEGAQFETRARQFNEAAANLKKCRERLEKLRQAGVPVVFVPKDGAALSDKAGALRAMVQENPHVLADPPFDLKYAFTDRLRAVSDAAEGAMREAWANHVYGQNPGHSDEILNALFVVPQFKPIVARMRQCKSEIASLALAIPTDPEASTARLKKLAADYRSAWEQMTVDDIPASVIEFLKACAAAGAPLSALTEEVRNWFDKRNLLGVFRIRL